MHHSFIQLSIKSFFFSGGPLRSAKRNSDLSKRERNISPWLGKYLDENCAFFEDRDLGKVKSPDLLGGIVVVYAIIADEVGVSENQ